MPTEWIETHIFNFTLVPYGEHQIMKAFMALKHKLYVYALIMLSTYSLLFIYSGKSEALKYFFFVMQNG